MTRLTALLLVCFTLLADNSVSRETEMVAMRDDVRLATDIYGADPRVRKPVLLARTPYNKDGLRARAEDYARHGYVVVIQDCRGRYASHGHYVPYNNDRQDGYDTLEWIHEQPWSNGKAGMFGGSHLGLVQWLAAGERAPGLVTITPAVTASSLYRVAYRDGALRMALISAGGWTANPPPPPRTLPASLELLLHHLPLMHLPLSELEKGYGWQLPWMTSLLRHPSSDNGFWRQTSAEEDIARMSQPAQLVTGYYDFFHHETMADFERLRARPGNIPVQLVMGPWTHGGGGKSKVGEVDFGPDSVFDISLANREWFDVFLRGEKKALPLVRYFSMGENRWHSADQWPPQGATPRRIEIGAREFVSDPANPVPSVPNGRKDVGRSALWSPIDLSSIAKHPHVVTIEEPLTTPLRIAGPVRAEFIGRSDPGFADWVVRLFAVLPNGFHLPLAHGITRGNVISEGPIHVDMGSVAAVLQPGAKLRIELAGSSFPMYDRNLHTGEGPSGSRIAVARQSIRGGAVVVQHLPD